MSFIAGSNCNYHHLWVIFLTFDISMYYATIVHSINGFEDVPGIVPHHLLRQSLLGNRPQGPLITKLHEHIQLILERRGKKMIW